jgi:hypothetical protein
MYNEPGSDFILTIRGICENIRAMVEKLEDSLFWQKVLVTVVCDGMDKISDGMLQIFQDAALCFEEVWDSSDHGNIQVHMFQSCNKYADSSTATASTFPPLQTLLLIKV